MRRQCRRKGPSHGLKVLQAIAPSQAFDIYEGSLCSDLGAEAAIRLPADRHLWPAQAHEQFRPGARASRPAMAPLAKAGHRGVAPTPSPLLPRSGTPPHRRWRGSAISRHSG